MSRDGTAPTGAYPLSGDEPDDAAVTHSEGREQTPFEYLSNCGRTFLVHTELVAHAAGCGDCGPRREQALIRHDDGRVEPVGDACLALPDRLCDPCLCNEDVPGWASACQTRREQMPLDEAHGHPGDVCLPGHALNGSPTTCVVATGGIVHSWGHPYCMESCAPSATAKDHAPLPVANSDSEGA